MTVSLMPNLVFRAFASDGTTPLVGGLLYTYSAGTTTPLPTYTDSTGLILNSNPVVLDSVGEASIWLGNSAYKFLLKDSTGVTQNGYPVDNVSRYAGYSELNGLVTALQNNLANTSSQSLGDAMIGVKRHEAIGVATTQDSVNQNLYFNLISMGGCVADGITDTYNSLQSILSSYTGSLVIDTGNAGNVFAVSQALTITGKDVYLIGNGTFKYIGTSAINAVLTITDAPNIVEVGELYFNGNGYALNGLSVECATVSNSKYIFFNGTAGGTMAIDSLTLSRAVIRTQANAGAGSAIRPKNVIARGIKTYTTGTHGFLPAYTDGVFIYGNSTFQDAANHGWEAVNCTNVIANGWSSYRCGLFGGGVGDGTTNFDISNFIIDKCANDGSFSIEHNCQNGSVHDFVMTDCYYPGINISYGTASNGNVNVKNINIYNGYCMAHSSNVNSPGINCYGSTGSGLSENINIWNVTIDGFNRAADFLYQKNGSCKVIFENPTGSNTYVIKGTLIDNCFLEGVCSYQVTDNAYIVNSFAGTDSKNSKVIGQVLQAGATTNKAVVTIDGVGSGFFVTAKTGGALNYINVQAGAACTLFNSYGNIVGTPWAGVCNPMASYGNQNNSMDFSVVGVTRIFSCVNNAGVPDFTNRIPPNTTPYFVSADMAKPILYTSGTPREWAYKLSTTTWVSQGNFL